MLRLLKDRLFHSLLIVSALICSAYGDYFLYWTTAEYVKNEDIKVDEVKAAALYAYAYDNETQTTTKKLVERMTADDIDLDDYGSGYSWLDFHQDSSLVSLGDTYSGYSFYVDLYSTVDSSQFNEENLIFNGLENNLTSASELSSYISENIASPTPDNYWHVNLSLVPEPSLGLMVLIGLSFLALRRRNGRDDLPWGGGGYERKILDFCNICAIIPVRGFVGRTGCCQRQLLFHT